MVATEQRLVEFYVFRLGLYADPDGGPGANGWPHVFAETEGFEIRQAFNFDLLLGMDVLSQCDLSVLRSGRWRLAFG